MNGPIRYTPEKQQELISRSQLCERLIEFGWIPLSPEDLGEDFIVQIYFQGHATGVSFYIQEKSVVNLHQRRKDGYLPYSFEVKDLLHWNKFVQPVVLVVWDTKLREGRWALIKKVVEQLDKKRPKWKLQKETRAYIPWNNTTDNDGLLKLQHQIGEFMFSVINKDKDLSMKLTLGLPDSESGREIARSIEKFLDEGEEITLKGDVIKGVDIPGWAKPWLNTEFTEITMGSLGSPDPMPVDVIVISSDGKTGKIRNIELKMVKTGRQLMHLSNAHQLTSLIFEFVFSSSTQCSASVQLNDMGGNVDITRDILNFMQALANGGKMDTVARLPTGRC